MNKLNQLGTLLLVCTVFFTANLWAGTNSFENYKKGTFIKHDNNEGSFLVTKGKAEITSSYSKSGNQSLHIFGGTDSTVEFVAPVSGDDNFLLTFWAERWTRSAPFKFRVEANVNSAWKEIYNGDKKIRVGARFLSHIEIDIQKYQTSKFRFIVSAPESAGILIDDLSLQPKKIMEIKKVTTTQKQIPVLIRKEKNPILGIEIETDGTIDPKNVSEITISTDGTDDLNDIESFSIHFAEGNHPFGKAQKPAKELTFKSDQPLKYGKNIFWVTCKLKESANLLHYVDAACLSLKINGEKVKPETASPPIRQRLGYAVRMGGDDGSKVYRIPGLATTNKGTLIGVYDIRYNGGGDLPGHIDVGMSRSTDGGQSWEKMQTIMDMGDDPKKFRGDGIGDPAVLVDRKTNTIWVAAVWSHGNRGWHGSQPGLEPADTGQFILVKSEDDGKTWSDPINITEQIKDPSWSFLLQGPGKGITMRDGTLVFPAQYQDTPENRRLPRSTIIYSKDHGKTWKIGTGAWDDTTEAQVVELADGSLMLNCRYNRKSLRVVTTTKDLGKTWQEHPTSQNSLTEPRSCMASLIRHETKEGKALLFFSNPNSTSSRKLMTIKVSDDEGMTWDENNFTLIDANNSAGYSCMTMVDDNTVGILYEGSQAHMTFQKFTIDELYKKLKKRMPQN